MFHFYYFPDETQGSFPKGELTTQSCELAGWAEKGQNHGEESSRSSSARGRAAQPRWHSSTHSVLCWPGWLSAPKLLSVDPAQAGNPSLSINTQLSASSHSSHGGNGQSQLWELEPSGNEAVTPLISWEGRKEPLVLSTVTAGWHIPGYSILLVLITQIFSI